MTGAPLLRRVVPDWAKRRHQTWSSDRFVRRLAAASREYLKRHDLRVVRGPFAGLEYPPELASGSGDLVAKLTGTYELELHDVISEWVTRGWPHVVNIGAAEGFYAVGFARAIPTATVIAYDLDDDSRARCETLAVANGVTERVIIKQECTPAELEPLPAQDTALLCDCEGCEKYLLDPALAPMLRACEILVELHDFVDATISGVIRERFEATHFITVIDGQSRAATIPPELEELPRASALS